MVTTREASLLTLIYSVLEALADGRSFHTCPDGRIAWTISYLVRRKWRSDARSKIEEGKAAEKLIRLKTDEKRVDHDNVIWFIALSTEKRAQECWPWFLLNRKLCPRVTLPFLRWIRLQVTDLCKKWLSHTPRHHVSRQWLWSLRKRSACELIRRKLKIRIRKRCSWPANYHLLARTT